MSPQSQKTNLNMALKIAIVQSRRTQRAIAGRTNGEIGEIRLSEILHERGKPATTDEKQIIAKVLRRHVKDLFPSAPDEAVAS